MPPCRAQILYFDREAEAKLSNVNANYSSRDIDSGYILISTIDQSFADVVVHGSMARRLYGLFC